MAAAEEEQGDGGGSPAQIGGSGGSKMCKGEGGPFIHITPQNFEFWNVTKIHYFFKKKS
jgi:hypothetical protein